MDHIGEPLELRRHDHVGEAVEDHVNLDPLARLALQGLHKATAQRVALPDKSFEKDVFPGVLYLGEHHLVELDAVGVELDLLPAAL